jgi:uncharacterized protein
MVKIANEIAGIVNSYRNALENMGIQVERIFLYGSYAKNKAHEGSDIDLVVISPEFENMRLLERMETLGIAAGQIGEPVQAYGFTSKEIEAGLIPSFLKEVLKKAMPVIA